MMLALLDVVEIGDVRFSVVGVSHDAEIKYDLMADRGQHLKAQPLHDSWIPVYKHSGPVDGCVLRSFGEKPITASE